MKVPTTPREVDRMAAKLMTTAADIGLLDYRLRQGSWEDYQLEDLKTATALLKQATELLRRHARRWREETSQ